ncbi:META domain-containing protein [uncultured Dokdonia sp.]|uniref:META domain-containing protein n=1 Tax=uncultured Dokdonia sp. TaxID=575653 RepID=UPI0026086BC9|nr:META domain-containing protein [uncultured Dokdonia sp.]
MTYSCTTTQEVSTQETPAPFVGTFIVNSLYGQAVEGNDLNIKINDRTSKISGFAGCNTYSLGYTENKNTVTFSHIISTRVLCEEGVMEKERQFLNIFTTTKEFSIQKDTLVLYDNGKEILKATRFIF